MRSESTIINGGESLLVAPTLAALIQLRAETTPTAAMLFDEHDRVLTFAQYADAVQRTAAVFRSLGVTPGDVVAWQLPTRIETVVLMGALASLDVTQVPVLPIHRERELRFMLAQSKARVLCMPGVWRGVDYAALARRVQEDLGTFDVVECAPAPVVANDVAVSPTAAPGPVDGNAVRWIFYSSGTTADPKGVMHVDRAAMASGRGMAVGSGFMAGDRYGLAFPFAHIGGLTNLCAALAVGFSLILIEVFDPPNAVDVFARHGATIVGGGPAFYRAYLEQQRRQPTIPILPQLRFMTGGGSAMPPAMHFEVRDEIGGRGCANSYGMTETCSILAMNHPDDCDEHLTETSGRIVPGMHARVVDTRGVVVPAGAEGEIEVRGEFLLVGYVDPALDATALHDGWFRTGDLGRIDAHGYVRVTGRLKDIIIRKGENISAKEIEDLLYTHPDIAEVAVVGLPDDERGELVCAVIVMDANAVALDVAAIAAFLEDKQLMRQKFPERVEVVGQLPRNAAGKVQKNDLVHGFR